MEAVLDISRIAWEFTVRHRIELADNLSALAIIPSDSVPLIYVDPPFNTGRQRRQTSIRTTASVDGDRIGFAGRRYQTTIVGSRAYADAFDDYLTFLEPRLREAHRVLAPNGTLYVHLDAREVHYVKILLDEIFGRASFLNEIIWVYDYGGRPRNRWPAKHDNILVYVKNPKHYVFNADEVEREPYMAPGLVTPEKAARGKLPSDCYSEDTDILTDRGWIAFPELTLNDRVASVAPDGKIDFVRPSSLHARRHSGPMCAFKALSIDLLVTPNHHLYVRPAQQAPHHVFLPATALLPEQNQAAPSRRYFLRNEFEWVGEEAPDRFRVPPCSYEKPSKAKPLPEFDLGDWCEFLGLYLARGRAKSQETRYLVTIAPPIKPEDAQHADELLARMGFTYSFRQGRGFWISNKQLTVYLRTFGRGSERFIPRELLRLKRHHLQRLYRGLMMGNGSASPRQVVYCTSSKRLADDMQELIVKLGSIATIIRYPGPARADRPQYPRYVVNHRVARQSGIHPHSHASVIDYDGMVYCCTVEPYHTLVVRRNGKPAVCGNCWWHTIVSPTGKEKTGYPTQKPLGVLKRIVAASSMPDDLVLDFFAGSGTTGAAALALRRRFHLIDNNPEALAVMARRFAGVDDVEYVGLIPSD